MTKLKAALNWCRLLLLDLLNGVTTEEYHRDVRRMQDKINDQDLMNLKLRNRIAILEGEVRITKEERSRAEKRIVELLDVKNYDFATVRGHVSEDPMGNEHIVFTAQPLSASVHFIHPLGNMSGVELLQRDRWLAEKYALMLADGFGFPVYKKMMEGLGHQPMTEEDYRRRPERRF